MIKNQDIVLLAVLMDEAAQKCTFAQLGDMAKISTSEAHGGINRLRRSRLVNSRHGLMTGGVLEFLLHGLKYVFPAVAGGRIVKGMPTSYAAPVASDVFAAAGSPPVWKFSGGSAYGREIVPIYPTVPAAAEGNRRLYDRLAILDMLRGGRIRERQFAERELKEVLHAAKSN